MTERDDRLQEHLEALDAGVPLDDVLASAGGEDADLLRLASAVRRVAHPAPARRHAPAIDMKLSDSPVQTDDNSRRATPPVTPPPAHARSQGLMSRLTAIGLAAALLAVLIGAVVLIPRLADEGQVGGLDKPDGEATARPTGRISEALTLPHNGKPGWLDTDTAYPPEHAAFSPDGSLLATGHKNGTAIIWDVATGERLHTFQGEVERAGEQGQALTHEISDITFSPDGAWLAAARPYAPGIDVWSVETGELVASLESARGLTAIAFSPDGARLAGAVDSGQHVEPAGETIIWSTTTWEVERTLDDAAPGITFSPDGATLATRSGVSLAVWTGGEAGPVKLWDVATGELRATIPVDGFVMQIALSPDGEMLAMSALLSDGGAETLLVDVATGETLFSLPAAGETTGSDSLAFSRGGALLVTGYQPNRLVAWNTLTGELFWELTGPADWLRNPVFSPDGTLLAANSSDGRVLLWEVGALGTAEQPAAEATEAATEAAPAGEPPPVGWLWCGYDTTSHDDAPGYELPPGREDAVESVRPGFWMAYPQSWEGLPGTCDRDRVAFISPETRTEVRVWVRQAQGGPDWLENVKQRWEQVMVGLPPDDLSVVESNVRLRDRDALLVCQPSHPGMGTVAALAFPEGNDLIAFYLYVGGDPTYWQAEADVFQTMLSTFSLGPEPSVSDFTFPEAAWCESYVPVSRLWGRVGTVAASDAVIVLGEPAKGFVTVSLAPDGVLVDAAGQPVQWSNIPPGAQIEVEGAAGARGNYVAERIIVHTGPTSALSAPPPGLLFVLDEDAGGSSLWVTDANGEAVRVYELLERLAGSDLDVSPTGDAVLFRAADDIWRLDTSTGEAVNVTKTDDRREGYPRWLPDGSGFVCGSQPAVSASGPSPGHLTLVTFDGTYEVLDDSTYLAAPPAPSPDGTTIAYSRTARSAAAGESFALYRFGEGVVEPDTAGAPLKNVGELSWSPDSTRLAVADSSEGYAGVNWFEEDMRIPYGLEVYKPAGIGGALPAPVWQPGGERLALNIFAAEAAESGLQFYASDERDQYRRELFIPNTTPTRHPAFTRDGHRLAYPIRANEVYVVDMATYEIGVWHAPGTVSAVGWAETAPVAPVTPPTDGLPADVADWDSYELPDTGITVPVPPGWTVAEWPVDDTTPFSASISIWPQWDSGETPPRGQPEISVTAWPRPAEQALRDWLDAHSTAAPSGSDTGAVDDDIYFFGVRDVEETTLGGQPALGFTRDEMGVQVLTIIVEGPDAVVGLSKTHADQFPLGPVFETMQVHMQLGAR